MFTPSPNPTHFPSNAGALSISSVYIEAEVLEVGSVDPLEYCHKWVPVLYNIRPGERGWKATCNREIARVTKAAISTIKNWGTDFEKHPDYVQVILSQADLINSQADLIDQMQQIIDQMQQISKKVPDVTLDD